MRILVVSTVYNSTPPVGYGGIQRVVHSLCEGLAQLGHDVILMAPPRSWCSGRTIHVDAYNPDQPWRAVKGESDLISEEPLYDAMVRFLETESIDVVHDWSFQNWYGRRHPNRIPYIVSTCIPPSPGYSRANCVASSKAHAALIGESTRHVYYGLPLGDWEYEVKKSRPAIHIAKIAPFKAQHLAILAAMRSGSKLVLAGNVENALYFNTIIRPMLAIARRISYIGELDGTREQLLVSRALIQTPRWFDCFPLVVLESLASATPVISLAAGGVPEQISHGKTGFLCDDVKSLANALENIDSIDPHDCRKAAESRFSNLVMAQNYLELYQRVIDGESW